MRSLLKVILLALASAVALAELYSPLRPVFGPTWLAPAVVHSVLAAVVLVLLARRGKLKEALKVDAFAPFAPAFAVLAGVGVMIFGSRLVGEPTANAASLPWAWVLWIPVVEELVFRVGIGDAFRRVSGSGTSSSPSSRISPPCSSNSCSR